MTQTAQIEEKIFDILEKNHEGVRWTDLAKEVNASSAGFHPKTVNGIIWKLTQKYPDKVYKTEDNLFCLTKYQK